MQEECSEKYYEYTLIKEDLRTGQQGKRRRRYISFENKLKVGGLYLHLGPGFPGAQRVLSVEEKYF